MAPLYIQNPQYSRHDVYASEFYLCGAQYTHIKAHEVFVQKPMCTLPSVCVACVVKLCIWTALMVFAMHYKGVKLITLYSFRGDI